MPPIFVKVANACYWTPHIFLAQDCCYCSLLKCRFIQNGNSCQLLDCRFSTQLNLNSKVSLKLLVLWLNLIFSYPLINVYLVELVPLASVCADMMSWLTCLRFLFALHSWCVCFSVCGSHCLCVRYSMFVQVFAGLFFVFLFVFRLLCVNKVFSLLLSVKGLCHCLGAHVFV